MHSVPKGTLDCNRSYCLIGIMLFLDVVELSEMDTEEEATEDVVLVKGKGTTQHKTFKPGVGMLQ